MAEMNRVLMVILDGFGLSEHVEGNAILASKPEFLNRLFQERPFARLSASGLAVGLPEGQMGNSEVGHLNIGAGRVVFQDVTRINQAVKDGSFFQNPCLLKHFELAKNTGKPLHLLGLVSDGGVHSMNTHLYACLKLAKDCGLEKVFIHAFTDGRDTSPTSGVHFIRELVEKTKEIGIGRIATISGRYYAMDRDNRWERIEKAYLTLVRGVGNRASDPVMAMEASYKVNVTDEFVVPVIIEEDGQPIATIDDGDVVLTFNYRADRMRQIARAFTEKDFQFFQRKELQVNYASFTEYSREFDFPVAFPQLRLEMVLGEVLSREGVPQFRAAETEKYAHVTYFMNGGIEEPFPREDRSMVPSPKVKTYDLKPEMSAFEVGDILMEKLRSQRYPFLMVNFANCDMVGHTGILDAAIAAVNTVDNVVSKVIPVAYELGYSCIITSDHGNVEQMVDYQTGEAFTEHTTNQVPFCLLSRDKVELRAEGKLSDIAPTILELMGIAPPDAMDGRSLIVRK